MLLLMFSASNLKAQQSTDVLILNNNVGARLITSDQSVFWGNLAFNTSTNEFFFWNQTEFALGYQYEAKEYMDFTGSVYVNHVNQDKELMSNELRFTLGFRIFRPTRYRFKVSNFSRLEARLLYFSDDQDNEAFRFRNLTHLFYSLNRTGLDQDKNFIIYGAAEWFANSEIVRERFFNLFKAKVALAYRFNAQYYFDLGLVYQDTRDETGAPVVLPTDYNTNFLLEWRFVMSFFSKNMLEVDPSF